MNRLFVYGTLSPGGPNEHILKEIGGVFESAFVMGTLYKEGWASSMGYPGIRLSYKSEKINGYLFISDQLPNHWKLLDEFEGKAYKRVATKVYLIDQNKETEAYIYELE